MLEERSRRELSDNPKTLTMQSFARVYARSIRVERAFRSPTRFYLSHTPSQGTTPARIGLPFSVAPSPGNRQYASASSTAEQLSQQSVDEELSDYAAEQKEKQHQRPWHREGVDHSPVRKQRSAGAMTKGVCIWCCPGVITSTDLSFREASHYASSLAEARLAIDDAGHEQ